MKNVVLCIVFFLLISGCKYLKRDKPDDVEVDTMALYRQRQDSIRRADSLIKLEKEKLLGEKKLKSESGNDVYYLNEIDERYLMIIGSFETLEFARTHAKKYGRLGYTTKVIRKPDGFNMVSAGTFNNLRDAENELSRFRKNVAVKSWIYHNN